MDARAPGQGRHRTSRIISCQGSARGEDQNLYPIPACRLLVETVVFFTDRNLMYSHSPRMNTLPHNMYSSPRPPVQPATMLLLLSSASVTESGGIIVER